MDSLYPWRFFKYRKSPSNPKSTSRRLDRAEIAVGAGFLHLVEGIAEHLIVRLLAVEQKVDGLSHLLVLNLTVEILVHHLGSLLRCNIGQ